VGIAVLVKQVPRFEVMSVSPVGVRGAGFVLAVNVDPDAPVLGAADAGIFGDWL
jgi:hypothetical protein